MTMAIATQMTERIVTVRYFAWVRERTGRSDDVISLPAHVVTIAELMSLLAARGEGYAEAFKHPPSIRVARDRVHVQQSAEIGTAREIGFFPPVTGG